MKPKLIIKLAVDVLMTLAMLFLMGYHFWGEILHEWVGAGMFLLFILHHILNGYCYKSLFKRKYNALRILTLCIDLLVLISMMSQMYSGVLMSRYVFDFLPRYEISRAAHNTSAATIKMECSGSTLGRKVLTR